MNSFYLCQPPAWRCGLSNQLYTLFNAITIARAERRSFLLVEGFNPHFETTEHCRISEVIDLEHLNSLFSDLTIFDSATVELEIERIEYGSYFKLVDLTELLLQTYYQDRVLSLPPSLIFNDIKGDPDPGVLKKLFLHFRVNSIRSHLIYEEHRVSWIRFGLNQIPALPMMLAVNQFNRPSFDWIASQIRFRSYFSDLAQTFVRTVVDAPRLNVIHLRLEPDALEHWGKINQMAPVVFEDRLSQIYIELINHHFDPAIPVLVLTGTPVIRVTESLTLQGYRVHIGPKDLVGGRELNAILDLLLGEHCTDVFIGNRGSTFDYVLRHRLPSTVTKVFLDLDRIDAPALINTHF